MAKSAQHLHEVICHKSIYEETVATLKATSEFMTVGDAREEGMLVGPVITETHRDRVESFIQSGIDDGGRSSEGAPK